MKGIKNTSASFFIHFLLRNWFCFFFNQVIFNIYFSIETVQRRKGKMIEHTCKLLSP